MSLKRALEAGVKQMKVQIVIPFSYLCILGASRSPKRKSVSSGKKKPPFSSVVSVPEERKTVVSMKFNFDDIGVDDGSAFYDSIFKVPIEVMSPRHPKADLKDIAPTVDVPSLTKYVSMTS